MKVSNHIKGILYLGNMLEDVQIEQKRCFTIQHFDYNYRSMLSSRSNLMNANEESIMNISIRVLPDMMMNSLYEAYDMNTRVILSVIFNGEFDDMDNLSLYDNAIIVEGYLIQLSEQFERSTLQEGESNRALMDIKVIMHSIKYVSNNSSLDVVF